MSGIFVAGYGFAFADILRDAKSVIEAEIHSALSIYKSFLCFCVSVVDPSSSAAPDSSKVSPSFYITTNRNYTERRIIAISDLSASHGIFSFYFWNKQLWAFFTE